MHFAAIAVAYSFTGDSRSFFALLSDVTSIAVIDTASSSASSRLLLPHLSGAHLPLPPSASTIFSPFAGEETLLAVFSSAASFLII